MSELAFWGNDVFPVEMHKVRVIQKLNLVSVEKRLEAIRAAGNNSFLLKNEDVFLDMLTDSGVNAMSDKQVAAMMIADDSYAGSASFERFEAINRKLFKKEYVLPVHQGRAAENILARALVRQGHIVPMNYHFTTTRAHIQANGGTVRELFLPEAVQPQSDIAFKGNMDTKALATLLQKEQGRIPFVRVEAGTNLIGGQPWSLANLQEVASLCRKHSIPLVLDASLLADNLYFIKTREASCQSMELIEITEKIAECCDIMYYSARKLGCARGGAILTSNKALFKAMQPLIPLFEGFLTYGGMSVREIEAASVGLEETMDFDMVRHGPEFIAFMANELSDCGVPVVLPAGGLGCHLNAREFVSHVPQTEFPAAALSAALYLASGVRGMERGTMSEERNMDGSEHLANMELLRLALPRRVFTLSQVKFTVNRILWLYENRDLIGGMEWEEEPEVLRFFFGRLRPKGDWQQRLVDKFVLDFGDRR